MLIKYLNDEILWDTTFTLSVKIVEHCLDQLLPSQLQAHPQLMLEVYFHIMPQVTAQMHLYLQWCIQTRKDSWFARTLMVDFGSDFTSLRAIVDMFTITTEFKLLVVFATINTLRQNMASVLVYLYVVVLKVRWNILSIMIQDDLQILIKGTVSLIESQCISFQTTFNQSLCFQLY